MITKIGESMLCKTAFMGMSPAVGWYRADKLTPEERALLIQKYGLPEDAALGMRNAGRGIVGGTLGGVAGGLVGVAIGRPVLGNIAGDIIGTKIMTDKYSRGALPAQGAQ